MIPLNDFKAEPEELLQAQLAAAERVFRSGWYVLGNELKTFENNWATTCGSAHSVGVGNGMDALELGLRALEIGHGEEVITTPMTAFATVLAIFRAGATPVLADIDTETTLLSPESVRRCISPRTKAILLVHLYGQVRDMDAWEALCHDHGLLLLEDCAQSHLAASKGRVAGNFGNWGAYSFYPTKNLGAIGDAGALNTNSADLADKVRVLRNYGQSKRYYHPEQGMNSRMDELQAAILSCRLEKLAEFTGARQRFAEAYFAGVSNPRVRLLAQPKERENHVYHLFVVTSSERDRLADHLKVKGVDSLIHYPVPMHRQEACKGIRQDPAGLSCAEAHAATCLSVPCHPQMTMEQVGRVIEGLNSFRS
jgi:dTDP-4-amino-4,6-dideoxygalactose transaminase